MIIILFLKGIICGFAIIIPGFSFSSLALILNIYDVFLNAINNFFHTPKNSLKILFPFLFGICISCLLLFYPLSWLLKNFPLFVFMFFFGLLIGGFYDLLKKIKFHDLFFIPIGFIMFFVLNFLSLNNNVNMNTLNFKNSLILILSAILCSFAALAPSLSITFILINFNLYDYFLNMIESFILLKFDNILQFNIMANLFIFFFVLIISIFSFSKIISSLLINHVSKTTAFFLGSSFASLIGIFFNDKITFLPFNSDINLCYYYFASIIFLIIALFIIIKLEKKKT